MSERDARLARLQLANDERRADRRERVEVSLEAMARRGDPINVHAVALHAGVSRSFLYSQDDILTRIRKLQGEAGLVRAKARTPASDASLRRRLSDALDRITRLTAERDALRGQVEVLVAENRQLRRQHGRVPG